MKITIKNIVEWFKNLSLCDFGIHSISHATNTGAGFLIGYCEKCGEQIML